jgi:hypothetical protein
MIQLSSPHKHGSDTVRFTMLSVIFALLPATVVSVYLFGWLAFLIITTSMFTCVITEFITLRIMCRPISPVGDVSAALTGLLLDKLRENPDARIVSTSSIAHKRGKIHFDDINAEGGYKTMERYAQSKLANLYFAYELQRRLAAAGDTAISVAAHPGMADTELTRYIPKPLMLLAPLFRPLLNTPAQGAWPTLCAATWDGVEGGDYYGPCKRGETAGPARKVQSTRRSRNTETAQKLWDLSIEMTGVNPGL